MKILDGKATSEKILKNLKFEIEDLVNQGGRIPRLDIILIGNDFASEKYVSMKEKRGKELGIKIVIHRFDGSVSEKEVIDLITKLNKDSLVDGIMVQLPIPEQFSQLNTKNILETIEVRKDVDGLTFASLGWVWNDAEGIGAATPTGVIALLDAYDIPIEGKNIVVVGRSNIVGLPLAAMFTRRNATVTIAHSKTEDLKSVCKNADILAVGIGKSKYITSEFVKEGVVVVDIGMNRDNEGNLVGDVDFEEIKDMCEYITPVPGGIGPMTIASLFSNLIKIYKSNVKRY